MASEGVMTKNGWFAGIEPGCAHGVAYKWRPVIQTDFGCLSVDLRFDSEAACLEFIRDEVVGLGLQEAIGGFSPSRKYRAEITLQPSATETKVMVYGKVLAVSEIAVSFQVEVSRELLAQWDITPEDDGWEK